MDTLTAYAIMLGMALIVASIIFQMKYYNRNRTITRQRVHDRRRREKRMAAREAEAAPGGAPLGNE